MAGIIVTDGLPPQALIKDCSKFDLPVVLVNRQGANDWGDRVAVDNEESGTLAFNFLVYRGAIRIGRLMPRLQTYSVPGRAKAFVDSAESRNIPCTRILVLNRPYEDSLMVNQELDLPTLCNIDR